MAIKLRSKLSAVPDAAAVEAFVNSVDGVPVEVKKPGKHKAINVPFNGEQFAQLEAVADHLGRSKAATIRWLIAQAHKEI